MQTKSPLLQNYSALSQCAKQVPKLYCRILAILIIVSLLLLYYNYSLSSQYKSKQKEYDLISSSNAVTINELQLTEEHLKSLNEQIIKNEVTLDETTKNVKNNDQTKATLAQSVAEYEKKVNEFNLDPKSLVLSKSIKEEYEKYQKELNDIQSEIYNKATIAHSTIINHKKNELKLIDDWFGKKIGEVSACYLSDVDGFSTQTFYKRCAGKGATLTIYQSSNHRFGGYTSIPWEYTGAPIYKSDFSAFLFSLDEEKKYRPSTIDKIILHSDNYFPSFGPKDLLVSETLTSSHFPDLYGNQIDDKKTEFFNKAEKFDLIRIEVYLLN